MYNLLDLVQDKRQSELLLASIEQRSRSLNPIPFAKAIDLNEGFKYVKYLAIPGAIFALIWLSGELNSFFGSYQRVVNYDQAYEPPAPFVFQLLTGRLEILENEEIALQVATEGEVKPDDITLVINGQQYLMQEQNGIYQHNLAPELGISEFYFTANELDSRKYNLEVLAVPAIQNFEVALEYPGYTGKPAETLKSTGNATFPEGTKVTWKIESLETNEIHLVAEDTLRAFKKTKNEFSLSRRVYDNLSYQLTTSNKNVINHEKLDYKFRIIKDAYPTLEVRQVGDTLNSNISYYMGEASDDYGLGAITLVCYPEDDEDDRQILELERPESNINQFYYTFPSGLELKEGRTYSFYFEVTDNDAIRGGKSVKSQVFTTSVLDDNELKSKQLEAQQSLLNSMDKSLSNYKEQKETLKEINKEQKEKNSLSFTDQNQIRDFLKKQQQQEQLMQKFSKQLNENLKKGDLKDERSELLQERLERQELEAKKNEKLLEELQKIADKIDKEELSKRLEELGKQQQRNERSLEQLLELTKRYYVTEKASQLARDLEKLAKRQDILSELKVSEVFSNKEQEKLNKRFEELAKELEELKKDNEDLKKPMSLRVDKEKERSVKEDQKDALEEINKHQGSEEVSESEEKQKSANQAKKKQKSAAEKIQEMSEDLQQSAMGGGSTITEDAEMLRQILDNLITFSFKQEKLYDTLEGSDQDVAQFIKGVREQQELKELFEHVDDSLFALSLRRVELSEFVNEQITEVYYNIDKTLESIAENRLYQGIAHQQYVLTASNELADFLAQLLDNMQQSMMPGSGSGGAQEEQLPDIIKSQGELQQKMEQMGQQGKSKGEGAEEGDQEGKGAQQGSSESKGEKGQNGEGEQGQGKGDQKGDGNSSGAEGTTEEELKELYEIYKEQQVLRQRLEEQLADMIKGRDKQLAQKLVRQMEDFENDLLENGITQRTLDKINTIQHQLLKLKNAVLKQGKKEERESDTNKEQFRNPVTTRPLILDNNRNEVEILNRQALPLRHNFQNKVKNYFRQDD